MIHLRIVTLVIVMMVRGLQTYTSQHFCIVLCSDVLRSLNSSLNLILNLIIFGYSLKGFLTIFARVRSTSPNFSGREFFSIYYSHASYFLNLSRVMLCVLIHFHCCKVFIFIHQLFTSLCSLSLKHLTHLIIWFLAHKYYKVPCSNS